jgi:hypothetical protein
MNPVEDLGFDPRGDVTLDDANRVEGDDEFGIVEESVDPGPDGGAYHDANGDSGEFSEHWHRGPLVECC